MSSTTYVTGEITFDPPLAFAAIRDPDDALAPYLADARTYYEKHGRDVAVLIEESEPIDTADGVLVRKYANRIVCPWPEGRNYEVGEQLAAVVEALAGVDRTYSGEFELFYQTSSVADFLAYRLRVDRDDTRPGRNVVHRFDGHIVWNDPREVAAARPVSGYTRAKTRR